jgi:hypothetical protein
LKVREEKRREERESSQKGIEKVKLCDNLTTIANLLNLIFKLKASYTSRI